MVNLFPIFIAIVVLSSEGEPTTGKIPPAFPDLRNETREGRTPVSESSPVPMPPGMKQTPGARPYSYPESSSGSAKWLLHQMSTTDSPELRRRAAEVWPISVEDEETIKGIIRALNDPADIVRMGARQRLSAIQADALFAYVMRTMTAGALEDVGALDAALPEMGDILDTFMIETIRTALETREHKCIALYCLGRTKSTQATPLLFDLTWGSDAELSKFAIDALDSAMPPGSTPQWIALLEHPDSYFKAKAVHALASLREPGSFDKLRQITLGQLYPELQVTAFNAVSDYPNESLVPLLIEIMETNRSLASRALQLLRQRTDMDLGSHPGPWREWLNAATSGPVSPVVPGQ